MTNQEKIERLEDYLSILIQSVGECLPDLNDSKRTSAIYLNEQIRIIKHELERMKELQ